jgi:hypothetical protein
MSHPAPAGNPGTDSNAPSEDDFAPRVRIVTVDYGTHLMQVGNSLEDMVDPSNVSLHVFMSQEALDTFLKEADCREVIVHLETVEDLDEPTLEVDPETERIRMRAANGEPWRLASDIYTALKRSFRTAVSKLKNLREAASPTPPPARARNSAPVSCADC